MAVTNYERPPLEAIQVLEATRVIGKYEQDLLLSKEEAAVAAELAEFCNLALTDIDTNHWYDFFLQFYDAEQEITTVAGSPRAMLKTARTVFERLATGQYVSPKSIEYQTTRQFINVFADRDRSPLFDPREVTTQ